MINNYTCTLYKKVPESNYLMNRVFLEGVGRQPRRGLGRQAPQRHTGSSGRGWSTEVEGILLVYALLHNYNLNINILYGFINK